MRRLVALCLLLVLPCAGCGDEPLPAGVLVDIITSEADGPIEGRLILKSVDDGVGKEYEAVPVGGDEPGIYHAPKAAPGRYRLLTDKDWGMLWTGSKGTAAPLLRSGEYPATPVRMGRPRTIYVAAADPTLPSAPVSARWGAEYKPLDGGDQAAFQRADIEIIDQGRGIIALRFPPEQWKRGTALRAVGIMADGTVSDMLSYTVRDAEYQELPRIVLVYSASQAPLTVHLVPPAGVESVPDGTPVRVEQLGLPLEVSRSATSYRGVVGFETLATFGSGLRIHVGEGAQASTLDLDVATWRRRQTLYAALAPAQPTPPIPLGAQAADTVEVRALYPGGRAFGFVPLAADATVRSCAGLQDLLLRSSENRWSHAIASVPSGEGEVSVVWKSKDAKACRVRGAVRGAGQRDHVEFILQLDPHAPEGAAGLPARAGAGQGFESTVAIDGMYEIELPPGRYRIRVMTPGGPRGRVLTQTFGPGQEVRLNLGGR